MRELVLSDDIVLVSYVEALLKDARIEVTILDRGVSGMPGAIGAVPQRIVVSDERYEEARRILTDAGLSTHLAE